MPDPRDFGMIRSNLFFSGLESPERYERIVAHVYLLNNQWIVKSVNRKEFDILLFTKRKWHLSQMVTFSRLLIDAKKVRKPPANHYAYAIMRKGGDSLDAHQFDRDNLAAAKKKLKHDMKIAFAHLLRIGIRYNDIYPRNIVYNKSRNSFVLIDFGKIIDVFPLLQRKEWNSIMDEMMSELDARVISKMVSGRQRRRKR